MHFHDGRSSVYETALVCATGPAILLLRDAVMAYFFRGGTASVWCQFWVNYFCFCVPGVLCMTVFSSYQDAFLTCLVTAAGILVALLLEGDELPHESQITTSSKGAETPLLELPMEPRRPFVTAFRAYSLLAAVIGILGVDFNTIFPRRFIKTHTFGVGLMDVGVGGFVIANGLTCREARTKSRRRTRSMRDKLVDAAHTIRSCLPLLALGLARFSSVYFFEHSVHDVEYGVYWNFFLTLAVVRIAVAISLLAIPAEYSALTGVVVIITYEYLLQVHGLKEAIIESTTKDFSRKGFFNANREGFCSCIGYTALYFLAVSIGRYIAKPKRIFREWLQACVVLLLLTGVLWLVLVYSLLVLDDISRRIANMTFIIWTMAHQMFLLSAFFLVDLAAVMMKYTGIVFRTRFSQPEFCLAEAVNRNSLLFFILANLLTALVNSTMNTRLVVPVVACTILIVYMLILSLIMAILHIKNVTIKCW